jgi:hypothetical protein
MAAMRRDQKRACPRLVATGRAAFRELLAMLNDLNGRAERIEPWVGLGLTLSVFLLALWLLPL